MPYGIQAEQGRRAGRGVLRPEGAVPLPLCRRLLAVFLVFVILYMAGVNRLFCIALCVMSATGITLGVFRLNRKYGPHGLMKLAAAGYRPYYIINRKRITSLFKRRKYAKHTQSVHPGK